MMKIRRTVVRLEPSTAFKNLANKPLCRLGIDDEIPPAEGQGEF